MMKKISHKQLTIGIDGNEANVKNRVGVNVYAFKLLHELKKISENKQNPNNLIVYLKEKPLADLPKETNKFKYKVIPGEGLWIVTKLTPYLLKNPDNIDVLFSPSHYTCPLLTIPRVCSIMDLGYLENSGQFTKKVFWQLKYWTAISIFASKRVLTISEASKSDIVRHYPFASRKIVVTPLSHDLREEDFSTGLDDVRRIRKKYSIVGDYILYLGTLKPSKNVDGIIKAYFEVISRNKNMDVKLVIAGKKGWLFDGLFKLVDELGIKDKVIFTDFFPEEDKVALRKGAKVFVQASYWEGFGIDVLSCMALGVPVIASNVGSLPEVAADAALMVDPSNIDDIAKAMEKVLNMDQNEYNYLIKKGLNQAKKFSWKKCALETLETLEDVVQR